MVKSLRLIIEARKRTPERAAQVLDRAMKFKAFHGEPYAAGRVTERPVMKVAGVARFFGMDMPRKTHWEMLQHFKTGLTKKVAVSKITPIQRSVGPSGVKDKLFGTGKPGDDGQKPVNLIRHQGKYYLHNGHHRYMAARLKGETHIKARVFDYFPDKE